METRINDLQVSGYTMPTDGMESDGTLEWKETTIILVKITAAGEEGIGYTYGHAAIAGIITSLLKHIVAGRDATDIPSIQSDMVSKIRNNGQAGLAMMAVSAVDIALWDLKGKLLGLPVCKLLGQAHEAMPIYGSGGFTSYTDQQLEEQLAGWVRQGITAVKMKVGRNSAADPKRVALARKAISNQAGLYVDANGAYTVSQSILLARQFALLGVDWFEEPVPADSPEQLAHIRSAAPEGLRIVAGEYGYTLRDFLRLLKTGAVDVLQADATRCGGITGFLKAGQLCEAFRVPFSSHCAPAVHLHAALSLPAFSIGEYFHDHVRIEQTLFEGIIPPRNGNIYPDYSRPGLGLVFREYNAAPYRVA